MIDALRARPLATPTNLAKQVDVSFATVARALEALEKLGIVREITGRKRARVFAYAAYLDLLSDGTKP